MTIQHQLAEDIWDKHAKSFHGVDVLCKSTFLAAITEALHLSSDTPPKAEQTTEKGEYKPHTKYLVWVDEVKEWVKHYYNGERWRNQEKRTDLPEFYEIVHVKPLPTPPNNTKPQ